jgi:hypothetical protein
MCIRYQPAQDDKHPTLIHIRALVSPRDRLETKSALGQIRKSGRVEAISSLLLKPDFVAVMALISFGPRGDIVRAFQTRRSGCSFIHELPTGAAETPSFQRQRSCHRQASHP